MTMSAPAVSGRNRVHTANYDTQHLATDILGVHVSAIDMATAVSTIESWIETNRREYVCILTVHSIMECQDNPDLRRAVNAAGLRTPDGMPLVWLSKRAGHNHVTRVYGPDLMLELAQHSATSGHRHYFHGGSNGVSADLVASLTARFPGLNVAGHSTPAWQDAGDIEAEDSIARINESGADIVWVGLGTPKQDWWVANHRPLLNAPVLIAVGAAFDFHSGHVRQAPRWMQRNGLEWLFRLSQDPKRLWKRYLTTNVEFLTAIFRRLVRN